MKNTPIWFVVVLFKPNPKDFKKLKETLEHYNVLYIDNSEHNRGFGGGANVGIKQALKNGAEWVIVLNQDIGITEKALQEFIKKLNTPAIVGPFAGSLDQKRWTTMFPSEKTDYISGSMIAIHKHVFEKIGYFYEPYFIYYEDVDFCMRAKKAGFLVKKVLLENVFHEDHTNEYYLARNHLLFVLRLAPLRVKLYELMRLPKTMWEYII